MTLNFQPPIQTEVSYHKRHATSATSAVRGVRFSPVLVALHAEAPKKDHTGQLEFSFRANCQLHAIADSQKAREDNGGFSLRVRHGNRTYTFLVASGSALNGLNMARKIQMFRLGAANVINEVSEALQLGHASAPQQLKSGIELQLKRCGLLACNASMILREESFIPAEKKPSVIKTLRQSLIDWKYALLERLNLVQVLGNGSRN